MLHHLFSYPQNEEGTPSLLDIRACTMFSLCLRLAATADIHPHPKQVPCAEPVCPDTWADLRSESGLCRATWHLLEVVLCNAAVPPESHWYYCRRALCSYPQIPIFSLLQILKRFEDLRDLSSSLPPHSICWWLSEKQLAHYKENLPCISRDRHQDRHLALHLKTWDRP